MIEALVGLIMGALLGYGVSATLRWLKKLQEQKTPLLLFVSPDGKRYKAVRHTPDLDGRIHVGKGENKKTFIVDSEGRYDGNLGSMWFLHARRGVNFQFPGEEEFEKDLHLQYAGICDPYTYSEAEEHNLMQDAMSANQNESSWLEKAAGPAIIMGGLALLTLLGMVGVVISKVG